MEDELQEPVVEEKIEKRKTLSEVIQNVRKMKLGVEDSDILKYVNDLEADVQRNVLNMDLKDFTIYTLEDLNKELLIPFPFYDVYELYVETMIRFSTRDFTEYNLLKAMLDSKYETYKAYMLNKNHKFDGFMHYNN